jgi:hypothetical protein
MCSSVSSPQSAHVSQGNVGDYHLVEAMVISHILHLCTTRTLVQCVRTMLPKINKSEISSHVCSENCQSLASHYHHIVCQQEENPGEEGTEEHVLEHAQVLYIHKAPTRGFSGLVFIWIWHFPLGVKN